MTDLREAAQMALDALEDACGNRCNREYNPCLQREAAEALRAVLAQPEQEPVAWRQWVEGNPKLQGRWMLANPDVKDKCLPQGDWQPLYTTPPQREWVGLTDEEYNAIRYGHDETGEPYVDYELFDEGEYGMEVNIYVDDFYRAIEAKLKAKNA